MLRCASASSARAVAGVAASAASTRMPAPARRTALVLRIDVPLSAASPCRAASGYWHRPARAATPTVTSSVQGVADAEPTPVAAIDEYRHRQVEHDLPGVAAVHLQPIGIGMRADAAADAVGEDALGAVADQVARAVAGQRLAEAVVVGGHVAVGVGADREHDP